MRHLAGGYTLETSFKNSGLWYLSDTLSKVLGVFPAEWLGLSASAVNVPGLLQILLHAQWLFWW